MAVLLIASGILALLTPVSYIPQYRMLVVKKSSAGVSILSIFQLALASQVQVATMLYNFHWTPGTEYGELIANPPSSLDWLGLVQVVLQWICSLVLLVIILKTPSYSPTNDATAERSTRPAFFSGWRPLILLLLHAMLFFLYPPFGGTADDYAFFLIAGFDYYIVNPLTTLSIAIALTHQANTTWKHQGETALSPTALASQAVLYLGLAISWPYRLALPHNLWSWETVSFGWICSEWYPVVGWACVNNAILALGQAVVFFVWYCRHDGNACVAEEERPLLAQP